MRPFFRRLIARLGPILQSDTTFVENAYREILGREADQDGLNHYRRVLREGMGRTAVLLELMRSQEFRKTLASEPSPLVSLRAVRPDAYRQARDRVSGQTILVFQAGAPSDFDWIEQAILEHGYYEQPGVWNLGVDTDKRVAAEIVAAFAPKRPLELGCAAGAVLDCLRDHGISGEGIEISERALAQASPGVRPHIHRGDLLDLELTVKYDMVFGLDVFEHLNPNRIDRYIERIAGITSDDAYVFCNIPAFGADPAFGTVFPLYLDEWDADARAGRHFSALHADELGYPLHGHLTCATAEWWVGRFSAQKFCREQAIEAVLHRKYDAYMSRRSPARKAFFVFSKRIDPDRSRGVVDRIRDSRSIA